MLKLNESKLVKIAVEGKVAPALAYPNEIGHDGKVHNLPSLGGITYNVSVGDDAFGWAADHVEPCVSTALSIEKRNDRPNVAYNFLACVGNEAVVVSGGAKGAKGVVVGHHGGVEHVMIDFPQKALQKMTVDDKIQIRSHGQGLKILNAPEVSVMSISPDALKKLRIAIRGDSLEIPVAAKIPAELMGSGCGDSNCYTGDIDIITSDKDALDEHKISGLKLGDIVAVMDWEAGFGWSYKRGAVTIGIIIHGDSHLASHGPGVTTILTSSSGKIFPKIDKNANIGRYLSVGKFRK